MNKFRSVLGEPLIKVQTVHWSTFITALKEWDKGDKKLTKVRSNIKNGSFEHFSTKTGCEIRFEIKPIRVTNWKSHECLHEPVVIQRDEKKYVLTHINMKEMALTFDQL